MPDIAVFSVVPPFEDVTQTYYLSEFPFRVVRTWFFRDLLQKTPCDEQYLKVYTPSAACIAHTKQRNAQIKRMRFANKLSPVIS